MKLPVIFSAKLLNGWEFKKNWQILQLKIPHKTLQSANLVIITFDYQKNGRSNHSVHVFRTNDDFLCAVVALVISVKRVLAIPGAKQDSKICSLFLL